MAVWDDEQSATTEAQEMKVRAMIEGVEVLQAAILSGRVATLSEVIWRAGVVVLGKEDVQGIMDATGCKGPHPDIADRNCYHSALALTAQPKLGDGVGTPLPDKDEPTPDDYIAEAISDELVEMLFERYDLDDSGTLNTVDELRSLTVNLAFALNAKGLMTPVAARDVAQTVEEIGEMSDENTWDVARFKQWFMKEMFWPRRA